MVTRYSVLAVVLFVVGCQTPSDYVGSGPLTLSESVVRGFEEQYKASMGPGYFLVSEDGRRYSYTFCPAGMGGCKGSVFFDAKTNCEKRAGTHCFVYAENGFVVWDGPVTIGNVPRSRIEAMSDKVLCNFATIITASGTEWEKRTRYKTHIDVAKSRNLTPELCKEISGLDASPKESNTGTLTDLSNRALCVSAVVAGNWSAAERLKTHVEEAKRRGLTPETCRG